jgi:hypothetical protein
MHIFRWALQIIIALGLLNVWVLRFHRNTAYRGGDSHSMEEEFEVYGLPGWFVYVIGTLKAGVAICLIVGVWLHILVLPAALLLCALMLGALAMHVKVRDPVKKSVPALIILILSMTLCLT